LDHARSDGIRVRRLRCSSSAQFVTANTDQILELLFWFESRFANCIYETEKSFVKAPCTQLPPAYNRRPCPPPPSHQPALRSVRSRKEWRR
jgi:hypothetical protein